MSAPPQTRLADRPTLAEEVRGFWNDAPGAPAFPANPVLRRLIEDKAFEHDGQTYRTAHRLEDSVCGLLGRLAIGRGLTRCLEIGTLYGFATLHLAEAMAATGGRVDTIDLRPADLTWDRHRNAEPQRIRNVHEVAERLIAESGLGERVRFMVGDSNALLPELVRQGARYELVLVDGAHDFPTVLLDVIAVDNLLAPGGWMLLDDVGGRMAQRDSNAGGPNRVLATLYASRRFEILPLGPGRAICRKEVT